MTVGNVNCIIFSVEKIEILFRVILIIIDSENNILKYQQCSKYKSKCLIYTCICSESLRYYHNAHCM